MMFLIEFKVVWTIVELTKHSDESKSAVHEPCDQSEGSSQNAKDASNLANNINDPIDNSAMFQQLIRSKEVRSEVNLFCFIVDSLIVVPWSPDLA